LSHLYSQFIKNEQQESLLKMAGKLADQFAERADEVDKEGIFPFENFNDLKEENYVSLTVPKEYGGQGINLYEFLMLQERIAQGDASTALSIGWHLGSIIELAESRSWEEKTFQKLCTQIVESKALVNRAATEPATGSPTRGGMPETKAEKVGEKWVINGRKSFTSMAVALRYSLVSARIGDTEKKGVFMVDNELPGVTIEEKWDTIAMRGTRSDDLVLKDVVLESSALVEEEGDQTNYKYPKAWLLHIPACYLGVAIAARNYSIQFANDHRPNSLPGPIKEVPEVQRKVGEIELELIKARHLLYSVADRWVNQPDKREEMGPELFSVKHVATNSAFKVVDLAMRIVGAKSLFRTNPMQRYYRDVRAGLHNPPMDDTVISILAKRALN
jgi:alkylation response protein AidB-like acyl-CoA dehydrogenase